MKIEKIEKLVANLHDKKEYVIQKRNLKIALYHGLALKKVHKFIKFNQKVSLKSYIDMNANLRKKAKTDFEKNIFKLMNNIAFGKNLESVSKYRDIKLITTKERTKYLVSELDYHTIFFSENLLAIEMKKTQIYMNKPVYLGLSILELSKIIMYEFCYG